MDIKFNKDILLNILEDTKNDDTALLLSDECDNELEKELKDIDTDLIENNVNAICDIKEYNKIIKYKKSLKKKRTLGKTAKIILIAAILLTSMLTITAVASSGGVKQIVQNIVKPAETTTVQTTTEKKEETTQKPQKAKNTKSKKQTTTKKKEKQKTKKEEIIEEEIDDAEVDDVTEWYIPPESEAQDNPSESDDVSGQD